MASTTFTNATQNPDLKGGTSLLDATVAATASGTATFLGKGFFLLKYVIRDIETDGTDNNYVVDIMANTAAATTTYQRIGCIGSFGMSALNGSKTTDIAMSGIVGIYNPLDYNVWVRVGVVGTVSGTGLGLSVVAYPLNLIN